MNIPSALVLMNIDGLNETSIKKILDTYINNIGVVKHVDPVSFFRDLQPVCKEAGAKAHLVSGAACTFKECKERPDGVDESMDYYDIVVSSANDAPHVFNGILTLNRDDSELYIIDKLYLFDPAELVKPGITARVTVAVKQEEYNEFKEMLENAEKEGEDATERSADSESDD